MSTLKVNTITNVAGQINVGKVVTIATYTDYNNVSTNSSTFITVYTFPNFAKKYDAATSSIYGFCSVCSLFEGSHGQNWGIFRSGTLMSEIRHRNAGISGWGMHSFPINFVDGAPAGSTSYTLQLKASGYGYYNYQNYFGNGVSHYTLMEVLN
jgi:hypothetical protein